MLAATSPREGQRIEQLLFALSLIGRGDTAVPAALREYLQTVLHQAKELAANPAQAGGPLLPEAIQLALEMRKREALSSQMQSVKDESAVTADDANKLLAAVEEALVRQD
jgi:hypothetical protein